jgi:DnaJ family protein A protein 2
MGGMNADDLFSNFFFGMGGGPPFGSFGGGPRRRTRGENSVVPYEVTLEDLYNGKKAFFMIGSWLR